MRLLVLLFACCFIPARVLAFFQNFINKPNSKFPPINTLKESLISLSKNKDNGIKASPKEKEDILKIVKELEIQNPSKNIGSNAKLNGSWELIYTSNTGSSAGKLGPLVGKVKQTIDLSQRSYTNYAIFGGGVFEASLEATWDDLNPKLWRVRFQNITFKLAGIPLVKKPLNALGIWRMTYLDDNYRVVYASRDEKTDTTTENVYVLCKDRS